MRSTAILLVAAALLAGCDVGSSTPRESTSRPPTAWEAAMAQVGPRGEVPLQTALDAFAIAVGPLPGVATPANPGDVPSGSEAIRWLMGRWSRLTPAQRDAVRAYAGPAGRAGAATATLLAATDKARYDALVAELSATIAGHLGRQLRFRPVVFLNQSNYQAPSYAYAWPRGTDEHSGPMTSCPIYINQKTQLRASDAAFLRVVVGHEVFHCFQAEIFADDLDGYYANAPDDRSPGNGWMIEGQAMWVGAELGPGESSIVPSHWRPYLDEPRTPLFQRTYDAIGFYARLADAGIDPWTVLDPMLRRARATSDPRAIFAEAVPAGSQDRFFRSWATAYAREPGFGADWTLQGPGLPGSNSPRPEAIANDGSVLVSADAYANDVAIGDLQADVVHLQAPADGYARVHSRSGSRELQRADLDDDYYCVTDKGCEPCPVGTERAGRKLDRFPRGEAVLTISGGAAGGQLVVEGLSHDRYCKPNQCQLQGQSAPGPGPGDRPAAALLDCYRVEGGVRRA